MNINKLTKTELQLEYKNLLLKLQLEEKYNSKLQERINSLENENEKLNNEISQLRVDNKDYREEKNRYFDKYIEIEKKYIQDLKNVCISHNKRNAGRKEKFTDMDKEVIKLYKAQGKTIREIADMYNCSNGLIHKIINN